MFATIRTFMDAYGRRSLDECMACLAPSPQAMAYGTNANEKRVGISAIRDQLGLDWKQMSTASMHATWHHEVQHGDSGWIAADIQLDFDGPAGAGHASTRATFAMIRGEHGEWLIEHMHFSVPAELAADRQLVD